MKGTTEDVTEAWF